MNVQPGDQIPSWHMPSVLASRMQTMAAILREAAKIAGDPVQAREILIVAQLVENGRAKEVLSRIFPASPS